MGWSMVDISKKAFPSHVLPPNRLKEISIILLSAEKASSGSTLTASRYQLLVWFNPSDRTQMGENQLELWQLDA